MRLFLYILLVTLFFCVLNCGGNGSDPLGNEESISESPGASRANTAIDSIRPDLTSMKLLEALRDIYSEAAAVTASASDPDSNEVRIMGQYYGIAFVSIIDTLPTSISGDYYMNLEVDIKDYYSDDGKIYLEGKLAYYGIGNNSGQLETLIIDGAAGFSGDYACTINFDRFSMALDQFGNGLDLIYEWVRYLVCGPTFSLPITGFITVESEGRTTDIFNPYRFDWEYLEEPPESSYADSVKYGCARIYSSLQE